MFNKLSTKSLTIVFAILLIIVVIFIYYDSNHGERTFRNKLVTIDTAEVTSVYLYPKVTNHKEIKLYKQNKKWKVDIANNRVANVPAFKIKNLFRSLLSIKPVSVAAQSKSKWSEYQVDTSGIEVKVYQGNDETLDLIVGKFSYQQPRSMSTYVRVKGDDNVYQVNGFISMSFNHKANYFRDQSLVNGDFNDWSKIQFNYPADSSFTMTKVKDKWEINGRKVDSAKTQRYLSALAHITSSNFVDDFNQSILTKPEYTVSIFSSAKGEIKITAYKDGKTMLIHSNMNPQAYFDGMKVGLWKNIYIGKKYLMK